jgi:uncharacterized protein
MLKKSDLIRIVNEQKNNLVAKEKIINREIYSSLLKNLTSDNRILVISGIRRSGKSTLLKQLIASCNSFCYVNFEDERFLDFDAKEFETLNEALIDVYGLPNFYFFDEIQNIDRFEAFVRKLQEINKKVILTGSNSDLISDELGSKLTGRYKSFDIFPFSFREFNDYQEFATQQLNTSLTTDRITLKKSFDSFFELGGMPEFLKYNDPDYIRTLFDNIIYKDVIARYNIKKQKEFREIIFLLVSGLTLPFTYNSLKNSVHLSNADTVKDYIMFLSNTFLLYELNRFDFSPKKQLNAPKKIFLADNSFHKLIGFSISENKGRRLENLVFIELKRRFKEIWYHSGKYECDFITRSESIWNAYQVCYELSDSNKDREINGLLEALVKFSIQNGLILTYNDEDLIEIEGKSIQVIPVWKWMFEY